MNVADGMSLACRRENEKQRENGARELVTCRKPRLDQASAASLPRAQAVTGPSTSALVELGSP